MRPLWLAIVAGLITLPTTACRAEGTPDAKFHIRGRPLPECHSFLITEMGVHYLLNEKGSYSGKRSALVTADGGYMRNFDRRNAAGLVLHVGSDDRRDDLGVGLRYRRWLRGSRSLNLTGGVGLAGASDEGGTGDLSGVTVWGELGFSLGDYVSVVARVQDWQSSSIEFLPNDVVRGDETTAHLGIKVGGVPGAILLGVTTILGGPPGVSAD